MGLNPFRGGQQHRSKLDVVMVGGALALTVAVVVWAIFGN
jgi:hypothetical protein